MLNKKILLASLISLLSGVLAGFLLLFFLSKLPFSPESKIYKSLGIKKPYIIGFAPFWLQERADKNYQPFITTYTYFGLTLDTDGTIVKLVNPQEEEPGWTSLRSDSFTTKLERVKKEGLVLSLLLHQANEASIAALLEKPKDHAQNLISSVTPLMAKYGFTDLNLDIESFKEASPSSQQQFTLFVQEVKKGIDENNLGTLTVEVTPISLVKPRLTDAAEIGKIADFIVLMAYDFHYIDSYISGPVAPIGGVGVLREYDVDQALKEISKLVPAEKIILGIPLYGYEWETLSRLPISATIPESGSLASNRRVEELLTSCNNCIKEVDEQSKQPYVIFPDKDGDFFHQIFYEDEKSMAQKLTLAKDHKIAGAALWALGYEGDKIIEPLKSYKNSVEWKL